MMKLLSALIAGLLFGLGLNISQMTNPQKVLNFLDVSGHWDPSLALVMASALAVFGLGYRLLIVPTTSPVLADKYCLPEVKTVDKKLLIGASIFGIGWGLAGICPGPALANVLHGDAKIFGFIAAMLIGMAISSFADKLLSSKSE